MSITFLSCGLFFFNYFSAKSSRALWSSKISKDQNFQIARCQLPNMDKEESDMGRSRQQKLLWGSRILGTVGGLLLYPLNPQTNAVFQTKKERGILITNDSPEEKNQGEEQGTSCVLEFIYRGEQEEIVCQLISTSFYLYGSP